MTRCKSVLSSTLGAALLGGVAVSATPAVALTDCVADLPDHATVQAALDAAVAEQNGGFELNMWVTVVNRDGEVCAVAHTGANRGDQWPGSRVISGQKANTANAFSLPGLALSTANLWAATQPGGSLFGLQFSNPVDTSVAYGDNPSASGDTDGSNYGTASDPMVGSILGGVNVFGGGLALYKNTGPMSDRLIGALGVSGDTSCADHNIAWRTRDELDLDHVPGGVAAVGDNMIFDTANPFHHPECGGPNEITPANSDSDDNDDVVEDCPIGPNPGDSCTPST